jgi:hypothetical protein
MTFVLACPHGRVWRRLHRSQRGEVFMRALPFRLAIARATFAAALLFACATGTPYVQYAAAPPALAAGSGRILIYMTTQQNDFRVALSLDGQTLGTIQPATFFYVDRSAGTHVLALPPPPHVDTFSQQAPTSPVTVELVPGAVTYVEVSVYWTPGQVGAALAPPDAATAQAELQKLELVPPGRL